MSLSLGVLYLSASFQCKYTAKSGKTKIFGIFGFRNLWLGLKRTYVAAVIPELQ
jgi:hypothetical protein